MYKVKISKQIFVTHLTAFWFLSNLHLFIRTILPVTSKAVISLSTQCSSRGEHDSCVQICDDTTDGARGIDAGLCAAGAGLERRENEGDLLADTAGVVLELAASVAVLGVTLNLPSILYQLHTALTQVLHRGADTVGNLHRHRKNTDCQ